MLLESVPTEISIPYPYPTHPSPTYSFRAFKPFYGDLKQPKQTKADQCRPRQTKADQGRPRQTKQTKADQGSPSRPNHISKYPSRGMAVFLISSSASRFHWVQDPQTTALGQDVGLQWPSLDRLTLPNSPHHKLIAKTPLGILKVSSRIKSHQCWAQQVPKRSGGK